MSKGLKLSEILVTVLIAVVFAIIYNLWWFAYNVAQVAGVHIEQLTYGVWFMATIVAYLIILNLVCTNCKFAWVLVKQLLWVNLISLQLYMLSFKV